MTWHRGILLRRFERMQTALSPIDQPTCTQALSPGWDKGIIIRFMPDQDRSANFPAVIQGTTFHEWADRRK